ncbi:hypothetical protein AArcSl_2329 [Halalkaliarchaeum desulfuricum]|uniref:Uncharacterized protein n=1 Tax=Halalkaliarchaeum desulfuricum TaxID=2055893 RepID=A0A343TLH9_9EURY|nr:hypothetical protein [Halalkaliarchaeum desulfuricum]AUX09951.1 hypothetical protein AArcSl_2329 [Halalkaliarchaeum desulfuricum]
MTEKKFTLLELHLQDGVQLSIGGKISDDDHDHSDHDQDDEDHDDHDHSHAGRNALFLTLGLLIGVAAAVTARRVLGSDLEAAEELDAMTD